MSGDMNIITMKNRQEVPVLRMDAIGGMVERDLLETIRSVKERNMKTTIKKGSKNKEQERGGKAEGVLRPHPFLRKLIPFVHNSKGEFTPEKPPVVDF